jgi:CopG family nickel-responsive transcriptional regulator
VHHLDDDSCMEVTALKGASGDVTHLAEHIIAERGVRYGRMAMIPTGKRHSRARAASRKPSTKALSIGTLHLFAPE